MKLTPRCQGHRFTNKKWSIEKYIDISKVGPGKVKVIRGTNEKGEQVWFFTSEESTDWVKLPKK
jgi:hypothetical protein